MNITETLREIAAMTQDQQIELRDDLLRRLEAGEIPAPRAVAILPLLHLEAVVPRLATTLRSPSASIEMRAAALTLLRFTTFDPVRDLKALEKRTAVELLQAAMVLGDAADFVRQEGTPFEGMAGVDPDDPDDDLDGRIDELLASFFASPEAAEFADGDELRFWTFEIVRLGVQYGFGSPATWGPGEIDELLAEILPRKVTLDRSEDAAPAVRAFRAFFRWAALIVPMPQAPAIEEVLDELEPDFPSMMMDESRFGIAKSFVTSGMRAGYDMTSEEGMRAFQLEWNATHALPIAREDAAKRKAEAAAKKRKAKMAKLSRKKNRKRK